MSSTLPASSPSSTSLAVSRKVPGYSFPIASPSPKVRAVEDAAQLLRALDRLCFGVKPGTHAYVPYAKIRALFCDLNLRLNELATIAPRFRPSRIPRPTAGAGVVDDDDLLSNDRQIIDLNWLHATKAQLTYGNRTWAGLTAGESFDFNLAADFVKQVGRAENKINAMGLTDRLQRQLTALQSKVIADRWRRIEELARQVVGPTLQAAADSDTRLKDVIGDWLLIWKCAELLGDDLKPKRLAELATLAGVAASDPSNTMKKREKVRKMLV